MSEQTAKLSNSTILKSFVKSIKEINNDIEISFQFEHEFNNNQFNEQLITLATQLKAESNKFVLAFKPPIIEENEAACQNFLKPLAQLSLLVKSIPISQGNNFIKQIQLLSKNTVKSIFDLSNSFLEQPICFDEDINIETFQYHEKEYLNHIGKVWKACDELKLAPIDNRVATELVWKDILIQFEDVINEISELKEQAENNEVNENEENEKKDKKDKNLNDEFAEFNLGFDDETYTKEQIEVITISFSLLKLIRSLFILINKEIIKKVNIKKIGIINWLDEITELSNLIMDIIDNLGTSLWDQDEREINSQIQLILIKNKELIQHCLSYCNNEKIEKWLLTCKTQLEKLVNMIPNESTNR